MYDNNSTDKPMSILKAYIDRGTVVYRFWPNQYHTDWDSSRENYSQKSALVHALKTYGCESRWIALIDTDEFLMAGKLVRNLSLPRLLRAYEDYGGVALAWLRFGTSGNARPPPKLVIDSYTYREKRADVNFKHIVQPHRLRGFMNIHEMFYYDGYQAVDESGRPVTPYTNKNVPKTFYVFRLHHYFTRSCVDWWIRVFRRGAVSGGLTKYNFGDLKKLDKNELKDNTASFFGPRVRQRLKWDGKAWQQRYFPLSRKVPSECASLRL